MEEINQSELDLELDFLYKKGICNMRADYSAKTIRNSLRQMYSEYRVGTFLEKNKNIYQGAIICGPDYYIMNKFVPTDDYFKDDSCIYTTDVNNGNGYTNGFYVGKINPLVKILKRYEDIEQYLPTDKDYEYILKKSFILNSINCKKIDLVFVKIRSNKNIARQGIMRGAKYNNFIELIKKEL